MKIHEYQAKTILAEFGVPVPRGRVATTASAAGGIAQELGGTVVVKAQIHAGGRGKGGGVKLARSAQEAEQAASQILGMMLKTHQTGPEGQLVKRVLVEEGMAIRQELYLGIVIDRTAGLPVLMASSAGGMEIEEVARTRPEAIVKAHVDPATGVRGYHTRKLGYGLGLKGDLLKAAGEFVTKLYQAFEAKDCSLAEINPLVITGDGRLLALDAKMTFDDNALSRHPEIQALRDLDEESPLEVEASKYNLNYIKLDGTVGCMVNGAGLAMATMDIIKLAGGEPANFLDVGGGASAEQIENAFRILISDTNVRAVFINIFGGILRCDRLAEGVIRAVRALGVRLPIVIRMEGTNVELGQRMLRESRLNFITAQGMKDGAEKTVRAARGA
ncbi:MAG: succinate--CoA ligase subunit beta [candidate division NC10 bacterium RIFCSPLOWO2_12_FULL_66_18]|nr:MAG: succinate--CoA ligase subunit beta [candidate division NC10 bacterium RIFCSPLOWO2_02_FULL_66_22]OGB95583.1 MAG: succinate--CoA ligase subunit beta [candidate division NC10 bacterium RIFCSPLOWO2_12_FULL_66_18]